MPKEQRSLKTFFFDQHQIEDFVPHMGYNTLISTSDEEQSL